MILDVLFDGESFTEQFNVKLAERPVLPVAEARYITYDVPGRNGSLQVFDGYEDVPLPLHFNYIDDGAKPTFREMVNWLSDKKTFQLSDTDRYRVLSQSIIDIGPATNDIREWCDFGINLLTEPFEYEDDGVHTITSSATITNPSNIDAGAIVTVFGTGTCRVRINDNQMEFNDVQGHVTVDGILKNAYRNGSNQNENMRGRYPLLESGNNEVEVSGATERIEIETRWCWR